MATWRIIAILLQRAILQFSTEAESLAGATSITVGCGGFVIVLVIVVLFLVIRNRSSRFKWFLSFVFNWLGVCLKDKVALLLILADFVLLLIKDIVRNSGWGEHIIVEVREMLRQSLVVSITRFQQLLLLDIITILLINHHSVILFKVKETTILLAYNLVILVLQGPVLVIVCLGKQVRAQVHWATLFAHHDIVITDAGQGLLFSISEEVFG